MPNQIPAPSLISVELLDGTAVRYSFVPYNPEGFFSISGQAQGKDKHGRHVFGKILIDEELQAGVADAILPGKLHPGLYDCQIVVNGYDAPYEPGVPFQLEHGSYNLSNIVQLSVEGGT